MRGGKEEILSRTDGGKSATGRDAVGNVGGERERGGLIIARGGCEITAWEFIAGDGGCANSMGKIGR